MRHKHFPMIALLLLTLLPACQSGSSPLPIGKFINTSDPDQVLEIRLDPTQTTNVFIRFSIETGANKYFGKSVGIYMLKTQQGSSAGQFVWTKSLRDGSLGAVYFTAADGKHWAVTIQPDGSVVDANGIAWKRA